MRAGIAQAPAAKTAPAVTVILASALLALAAVRPAQAADGPAFDCRKVEAGSMAAQVCADPALAALDRQLSQVFAAARALAAKTRPPYPLAAEQRGWIKGRDDCWKEPDRRACIEREYKRRTAELQARYRLLPARGPVRLVCDGDARNEVLVNYFATDPPSLIAERGDQSAWMLQEHSASGTRYVGRNETLAEHQGTVSVVWGYQAKPLSCKPAA